MQSVSGQKVMVELENAFERNSPSEVLNVYNSIRPQFESNSELGIQVNDAIAKYFISKSAYTQGVQFYENTLEYYILKRNETGQFDINELFCLGSLGFLHLQLTDTLQAHVYLDSCLQLAKTVKDPFYLVHAYNNLGLLSSRSNNYDLAIQYFQLAKAQLGNGHNDSVLFGSITGNLAKVNLALGDVEQAIDDFEKNLLYSALLKEEEDYCLTVVNYIPTLIQIKNYQRAKSLLDESRWLTMNKFPAQRGAWLGVKALFESQIRSDSAQYWLSTYQSYTSQLLSKQGIEVNHVLNDIMDKKIELTISEQQLRQAQQDREAKKSIIKTQQIALLLLIILSVAVVALLLYRRKVLQNEKLLETQQLKTELVKQQLENESLKNEQLDWQLTNKTRDVTNLAIDIHDKHEMQQNWSEKLKKLKKLLDTDTLKVGIDELLAEVEQNERIDKEKVPLKNKVDEVNSAFYDLIATRFPDLTKSERELCGLIRLNMSTKEIATLKNITPGSAKVMKHRLRKKLGLETTDELYLFVSRV